VHDGNSPPKAERAVFLPDPLTFDIKGKFKYPVKVITAQSDNVLVIVSAYPLKKRRKK